MKTSIPLSKIQPLFALLLGGLFLFSACNNSDDEPESLIADEDAIEVIESAFTSGTQGLTDGITAAALIATPFSVKGGNNEFCGVTFDSTLSINISQTAVTASYSTTWTWTVNCNNFNVPQSVDFQSTADGSYETNRSAASNQIGNTWTVTNLVGGDNWTFNGNYNSSGSFESKVRNQNQLNSTFAMTLSQIQVSKDNLKIVSGNGVLSLLLSDGGGNSKSFEGAIVFLGNQTATLTINNTSYDLDWN